MKKTIITVCLLSVFTASGTLNYRQGFEFDSAGDGEGWAANNHILIYRYWLIYGDLDEIRNNVYELHTLHPHG